MHFSFLYDCDITKLKCFQPTWQLKNCENFLSGKVLRKGRWPLQLHQLRRVELGVWALPLSEDSVVKPLLLSALKHQVHAANCVSFVWWDLMFPGVHAMWFTTLGTSSTAPSQSCSHLVMYPFVSLPAAVLPPYLFALLLLAFPSSFLQAALSVGTGVKSSPAAGREAEQVSPARLSRGASEPARDLLSLPVSLSTCQPHCHSAASTPSPDQMLCRPGLIWSELWCKLYFCDYFSSAFPSCSVILMFQFLF